MPVQLKPIAGVSFSGLRRKLTLNVENQQPQANLVKKRKRADFILSSTIYAPSPYSSNEVIESTDVNTLVKSSDGRHIRSLEELTKFLLYLPLFSDRSHELASVTHRQNLAKLCDIPPGAWVLEAGPGRGNFTVFVADVIGHTGYIVGVDPHLTRPRARRPSG